MTHTHFTNGMHSPEGEHRLLAFAMGPNKTAKEAPKESDIKGAEGDKDLYDTARKNVEHFQREAQNYLRHDFVDEKTKKQLTSKIAKLHDSLNAKLDENCEDVTLKERQYEGALRNIENLFSRLEAENTDLYDVQPYNERMQQKWEGIALKSGKLVATAYADGKYVLDFPERWKVNIPGKPHDVSQSRHRAEFDRADVGATVRVEIPGKKPYDAPVTEGADGGLILDLSGVADVPSENKADASKMEQKESELVTVAGDAENLVRDMGKMNRLGDITNMEQEVQQLNALYAKFVNLSSEGNARNRVDQWISQNGLDGVVKFDGSEYRMQTQTAEAPQEPKRAPESELVTVSKDAEGLIREMGKMNRLGDITNIEQEVAQLNGLYARFVEASSEGNARNRVDTWLAQNGLDSVVKFDGSEYRYQTQVEKAKEPKAETPVEAALGKSPEQLGAEAETQLQLGKDFLKDIESGAFVLDDEGANRIEGQVSTMRVIMREMQDAGADAALGEEGERLSSELIAVAAALEAKLSNAPAPAAPEATEELPTLEQAQAQLQELLKEADFAVRSGNPDTALDEVNRYIEGMRDKDAELHGSLLMLAVDGRTFERPVTGDRYDIALDGDTLVLRKVEAKTDNPELEQAKNRYIMIRGMLDGLAAKVDGGDLSVLNQLRTDAQDAIELRRRDIQDRSKEAGVDPKTDALMTELRTQLTELQNEYLYEYRDFEAPKKAEAKSPEAADKTKDPMAAPVEGSPEVENRRREASSAYYMLYTEITEGRGYDAQLQDLNASSKGFEQTLKDKGYDVDKYYEGVAAKLPQKFPQADGTLLTLTFDAKSRTFSVEKGIAAGPDAGKKAPEAEKKSPKELSEATDKAMRAFFEALGLDPEKIVTSADMTKAIAAMRENIKKNPALLPKIIAALDSAQKAVDAELAGSPDLQTKDSERFAQLSEVKAELNRVMPVIQAAAKAAGIDMPLAGPAAPGNRPTEAGNKDLDKPAQAEFSDKERAEMERQAREMLKDAKPLSMTQKEIDKLVGRVQMNTGVSVTVNLAANKFDPVPPTTNFEKLLNHISGFVQFITATFDKKADNETLQQKRDKEAAAKAKAAPTETATETPDQLKQKTDTALSDLETARKTYEASSKDSKAKEQLLSVLRKAETAINAEIGTVSELEQTDKARFDRLVELSVNTIPAETRALSEIAAAKAPETKEGLEQKRKDVASVLARAINKAAHADVVAISKDSWQATVAAIVGALNPTEGSPGHKLGLWFNQDTLEEGEHAYFDFDNNIDSYDFVGGSLGKQLKEDPIKGARAFMKINAESWRYENSAAANTLLVIQNELRTNFPELEQEARAEVEARKAAIAESNSPDYSAGMIG